MQRGTRTPQAGIDPFAATGPAPRALLGAGWLVGSADEAPAAKPQSHAAHVPASRHRVVAHAAAATRWGGAARQLPTRLGAAARLVLERPPASYPIADVAWVRALSREMRRELVRHFRAATPRRDWGSRHAAHRHLASLVPTWPVANWHQLRGVHVFLGSAGSGKTTLVLKLAHQLRNAGRQAIAVSLFPETWHGSHFVAAAAELDLPFAVIREARAWQALLRRAGEALLLVDTPCFVSDPETALRLRACGGLSRPEAMLHYVLCLHHAAGFVRHELRHADAHGIDCIALGQADLAPGCEPLLELQLRARRRISLVNDNADLDSQLPLRDTDAVLHALGRRAR